MTNQSWIKRLDLGRLDALFIPLIAGAGGLLVGAVMLLLLGANPITAYVAMAEGAFGSPNSIADTLVKATPLLFVGIGICIAYRGGVINIGGEGQIVVGALATAAVALTFPGLPAWIMVPSALLAGFIGGGFWGAIAGVLKSYLRVNEVLSTVMLNFIAIQFMGFLLHGPLLDPTELDNSIRVPQTQRLPVASDLPRWVPTSLHLGVALAVVMAVVVYLFLWRTTIGYRIRAVGLNAVAARYAGISVARYQVLAILLSGAFAGLGGAVGVLGVTHRLFTDGSLTGFTGNAGFNGIVAALFGGLHPIGTIPASILFGALLVGANSLQRTAQVPSSLVTTLDGLIVIFVVSSQIWARRRSQQRLLARSEQPESLPPTSEVKSELAR